MATVNSKELERVNSVKVLGVAIASTLEWNCHISDVIKKANKRMFCFLLLERGKVPARDIISFYLIFIIPIHEYSSLPSYTA